MFETAEVGTVLDKAAYKRAVPKLRESLLQAQKALAASPRQVVLIVGGVEGAGKSELVNLLLAWMDARGIEVYAFGEPSDEERERPEFWRFWRTIPPKGKLAILLGSWYTAPIVDRTFRRIDPARFDQELDRIADFERMLVNEGVLLVKLWLHLSKDRQRRRLRKLEEDPETRWRVTKLDWKFFAKYDRFRKVSERAILKTSTGEAPWNVVDASDERHRTVEAVGILLKGLAEAPKPFSPDGRKPSRLARLREPDLISSLDYSLKLSDKAYKAAIERWQGRLATLTRLLRDAGRSMILVFEGADAAGKGGAIRRITGAMDARNYRVISTAAPTDEEKARPYLWRFWRDLPRLGRTTIYDRSWYGRVLVERLEGFCAEADWKRAYNEINAFEEQLSEFGTVIVKFWLAITPEEQLRRFSDRQKTPYKQYKLTEEDWRNREKWNGYEAAACEMIERTSTAHAPWVPIEAEDKRWARVKVLKTVCRALEKALR